MTEAILLGAIVAAVLVCFGIGINGTATAMSPAIGPGIISHRKAAKIVSVFVVIGALFLSSKVMHTVGTGIVNAPLTLKLMSIIFLAAGIWVISATFLRLPVSPTQSIIGAVIGVGIATTGIQIKTVSKIALCWLLTPFLAFIFGFLFYKMLRRLLRRVKGIEFFDWLFGKLVLVSMAYVALTLGANDVGNVMGVVTGAGALSQTRSALLGGITIAVGALTLSRRVARTVGYEITKLSPQSAITAQFSAALTIHIFVSIGVPVSITQALVGAIFGTGIASGFGALRIKTVRNILIGWVVTPSTTAILAIGFHFIA